MALTPDELEECDFRCAVASGMTQEGARKTAKQFRLERERAERAKQDARDLAVPAPVFTFPDFKNPAVVDALKKRVRFLHNPMTGEIHIWLTMPDCSIIELNQALMVHLVDTEIEARRHSDS